MSGLTRGERVIAFIERYCRIPSGDHVGAAIVLEPFQKRFILDVYDNPFGTRRGYLSIARKNGKGLALDTPLPTPGGWKTIGQIREGDTLFDELGQPCTVQFLSPIHIGLRCWRLTFSDGSTVVADEQHRWLTTTDRRADPKITTTPEIAASVRKQRSDGGVEFRHSIAVAKALASEAVDLPLDPYLLGCWLGDGASAAAKLTCGDQDVAHFTRAVGDGLLCTPSVYRDRTVWTIGMSGGQGGKRATKFQTGLRALGVLGDKHIPDRYLWAGTEQRRALLQGLMDTDGTANATGHSGAVACSFAACNERLAGQFLTLARSLGLKSTLRSRPAKLHGRQVNTVFEVQFTAWRDDAVFRLPRKLDKLLPRPTRPTRSASLQIVACDEIDSVPTRCLQVSSPSSLFLAGHGMVPTHNTALIASIVLAHIVGPEARLNTQIVSGAMSREQAGIVFELAHKMIQLSKPMSDMTRCIPSKKMIIGLRRNVEYKALSAEGKTAHGLSPVLAILDEVGQVEGPTDKFITAITTSQGAYEDALLLAISTQAEKDTDLFSTWLDMQEAAPNPRIISHVYSAPAECALDDRAAWMMANPALGKFKAMSDLVDEAALARQMPANEPAFRNLSLNQRVESLSPFVPRAVWQDNGGDPGPLDGQKVWGGLDLSSVNDLTALVLVTENGGVHPTFWLPKHGLKEKGEKEHVPYAMWEKQGKLLTTPGRAIEYEFVAEYLRGVFDRCDVQAMGFDRYNMKHLKPWLVKANFSEKELEKFIEFGQGTMSMTPALRDLEVKLLNKQLRHGNHDIMNMCAANCRVVGDSGARKFDKARARGRIDGMTALANAIGVMPREAPAKKTYQMFTL